MSKKPATFEVHFRGGEISPERIPLNSLSRALGAVQRLSIGEALVDEEAAPKGAISLLGVKRGSAIYPCVSDLPAEAKANLLAAGRVLQKKLDTERVAYAFNPIEDLSTIARSLDCEIQIREPDGDTLAVIDCDSFEQIKNALLLSGETSFMGYVERAGGATEMRCALRVPFQPGLLYCKVDTKEAVRELGQHLYQDVEVEGHGYWIRGTWRVIRFAVAKVRLPNRGGGYVAGMKAIREAGGKGWDKIKDPVSFLSKVTGD